MGAFLSVNLFLTLCEKGLCSAQEPHNDHLVTERQPLYSLDQQAATGRQRQLGRVKQPIEGIATKQAVTYSDNYNTT